MGQKINPISLRIGNVENWRSRWFMGKNSGKNNNRLILPKILEEDYIIRKVIKQKINQAGIVNIDIERISSLIKINIKAAKPGLIIGQGGKGIEDLSKIIEKNILKLRKKQNNPDTNFKLSLNIEELKRTEASAQYIAQQIAWDIEKRIPFRLTCKKNLEYLIQNKEVKGAKIIVKGRLDGAEIARHETFKFGALPLNKLRAKIDYGTSTAFTTYGTVGVKVWIYKGEIFKEKNK
ncbi:MAG: 30S ribosomal protein S3 [Patescibacteria group bacterium]|nr:30S ribosomal protein S3 [Patescibacteria group bacterium]